MRSLSLLGAGAQPWSTSICSVKQDRLAYASTVAIYVYQREGAAREWRLRCILTEPGTAITTLAWHPIRPQLLASSTSDLRVCVWCVLQQRIIASVEVPSEPSQLDWNPFERDVVSFVHGEGRLFLTWAAQEGNKHTSIYREHAPFSSPALCLQWHSKQPGRLVFGHADGSLSFYAPEGRVQLHTKLESIEADGEVRDVQWDILSEDYLLVAHSAGSLRLVSAQGPTILATFRHPASCRARCIAWLPDCPGMFVTGDDESGVVRVWTVGRESALENRALQSSGTRALLVVDTKHKTEPESNRDQVTSLAQASLACVFSNGGLGVYNLRRATWEMKKEAGHTETVFTCAFKPDDSDTLATGSFDGTVKFWSCCDGEVSLQSSTPGRETIIYSVSWSPAPSNMIAAATARNGVLLIDSKKARVTQRLKGHGDNVSVYCVAWCQEDPRRLASGGADGSCLITQHKGELEVQRCSHPAPVFGCDWLGRDFIATACDDANVRVFKVSCNNYEIPVVLSGHTAKVFSVRWNPVMSGVLCSGSDDNTVRVWNFNTRECIRELTGHTGPVRGLGWSPSLPHLLTSGSWDFTLRVWDARSGECLAVQQDHGADVYGLSVHPLRPLLLASCSRDSTVRLWTLAPLVAKLTMTALIVSRPLDMLLSEDFRLSPDWTVRLCGSVATKLRDILSKDQLDEVQKFLAVIDALNGNPSVRNLWDLLAIQRGTKEISQLSQHYTRGILHASHVTTCQLAEGTQRELRAGVGSRGEAGLHEAATSFLRAGALRRYCELMARLGQWDKALSVAPGVSLKYWRQLNTRRVSELYASESEQVLPHALAQGDIESIVKFYASRGQLQESFLFSALSGESRAVAEENEDEGAVQTPCEVSPLMASSARALAERQLQAGFAVRSACILLAVDDIYGAMQTLLRGHEIELVVVLGRALGKMSESRVHRALALLALRARRLGEWRLAIELLSEIDDPKMRRHEVLRMLVQFSGPDVERAKLHQLVNLPDPSECSPKPGTQPGEAIRLHLAAGETLEALELGMAYIPELLKFDEKWNPEEALKLATLLQETGSKSTQLKFLSAYIGCLFAIRRRYPSILQLLIDHAKDLLRELNGSSSGLNLEDLHALKENVDISTRIREVLGTDPDRGSVYVSGCQMPAHSSLRRCVLTNVPIRGPSISLDASEESNMALGDAIMWAKSGAMSPLGTMMNPF